MVVGNLLESHDIVDDDYYDSDDDDVDRIMLIIMDEVNLDC